MLNATLAIWLLCLHAPVLHFHPNERFFPTSVEDALAGIQGDPVIYGHVSTVADMYRLVYYTLYVVNDYYYRFLGIPVGYHRGDLEHIVMYVDRDNIARVRHTYLSAHSFQQGTWVDGKLQHIYVARASHAHYPTPQTFVRVFGFANDQCSDKGKQMDTQSIIELVANQWWTRRTKKVGTAFTPNNHDSFNITQSNRELDIHAYGQSLLFRSLYPLTAFLT